MINIIKIDKNVTILRVTAAKNNRLFCQSNSAVYKSRPLNDSITSNINADSYIRIRISTNLSSGVWGIDELIVGKNATKARARVAIVASLPLKADYWKKTMIPINPSIQIGTKIVKILIPGYL
jgi:hypothetical protein